MAGKRQGLKKGDVLKGKYEILRLIGEGGMSRVFMAADLQLTNKQWAVKEVDRRATDASGRPIEQTLAGEAEILSRLDHPNIVDIVDIEKTESFVYVVMDHVPGQTLAELVRKEGPQSEEDVQRWMLQICDALGYLHGQNPPIIYRDMKPSNVMLHPDGYVKIIDFGVAREYKDQGTKDTMAFGTEGYAPPEAYGKSQTNPASDVYTIGATMWHLLAGEAPSETPIPDVREKNPSVGEGFAEVIIPKCTKLDRPLRYQSCDELAADLEQYQELTKEFQDKQKRKVLSFGITGGLAVVLCLAGFGMLAVHEGAITENYGHHMTLAETQHKSDPEAARAEYLEAIGYRPNSVEAYEGLLASYEVDGVFDEAEQKEFGAKYRENLDALKTQKDEFAELSYKIGRLYWTQYEVDDATTYDDQQEKRAKNALEYFRNAVESMVPGSSFEQSYGTRATMYYNIAQFTADISNAINAGDDNDLYPGYWENLKQLSAELEKEQSERDTVDGCKLIAGAMETYMSKFKDVAHVGRDEMSSMYETMLVILNRTNTTADDITAQKEETIARLKTKVLPKISAVYDSGSATAASTNGN